MYIVIMAGGSGQRFWPLSTPQRPKQCLDILEGGSLIQIAFQRALLMTQLDHVLVVTGPSMAESIRTQLPALSSDNLIVEPSPKNTAACVALATLVVESRGGKKILFWPADHHIDSPVEWKEACSEALRLASVGNSIALVGVVPEKPHSGFGHLCLTRDSRRVEQFIEKPDIDRAKELMESHKVLWNAGVCAGPTSAFVETLMRYWPAGYTTIKRFFAEEDPAVWNGVERISFDYAVLEKIRNISVVSYGGGWSDLGDWKSIENYLPRIEGGRGITDLVYAQDANGNVVYSPNKPVAVIGLSDIVIVDSPNGLLVMKKELAQQVRGAAEYCLGQDH